MKAPRSRAKLLLNTLVHLGTHTVQALGNFRADSAGGNVVSHLQRRIASRKYDDFIIEYWYRVPAYAAKHAYLAYFSSFVMNTVSAGLFGDVRVEVWRDQVAMAYAGENGGSIDVLILSEIPGYAYLLEVDAVARIVPRCEVGVEVHPVDQPLDLENQANSALLAKVQS